MKITFELSEVVVQDYLDHYNQLNDTDHKLADVTDKMAKSFGELAEGELVMRTDDLHGFEAEDYFTL